MELPSQSKNTRVSGVEHVGLPRLFSRGLGLLVQFFPAPFRECNNWDEGVDFFLASSETGAREDRSYGGADLRESADHGALRDVGELARGEGGVEAGQAGDRRLERVHHAEEQFHGQQAAPDPRQGRQRQEVDLQGRESEIPRRGPRANRDRGRCL